MDMNRRQFMMSAVNTYYAILIVGPIRSVFNYYSAKPPRVEATASPLELKVELIKRRKPAAMQPA